jgi:AcrR family transcriptional regulator
MGVTEKDGGTAGLRKRASPPRLSKSERTRAKILDAAMHLYAEVGYNAATHARIADRCELTRGAMLYHFPTHEALVAAAVAHIDALRAGLFEEAVKDAPHGADRTDHAIDTYWRLLKETPFIAFAELESAARTDAALRALIVPAQEAFDRAQVGAHLFDLVQAGAGPRFQASRDIARFMLEGLARAHLAYDADQRTARLLAIVKRAARMLNRKGGGQDLWEE